MAVEDVEALTSHSARADGFPSKLYQGEASAPVHCAVRPITSSTVVASQLRTNHLAVYTERLVLRCLPAPRRPVCAFGRRTLGNRPRRHRGPRKNAMAGPWVSATCHSKPGDAPRPTSIRLRSRRISRFRAARRRTPWQSHSGNSRSLKWAADPLPRPQIAHVGKPDTRRRVLWRAIRVAVAPRSVKKCERPRHDR